MVGMLPWNHNNSQTTIHSILELYQICRRNGDWNHNNSQTTIHSILELYQICRRNGDWENIYSEIRISNGWNFR